MPYIFGKIFADSLIYFGIVFGAYT